MRGDRLTLVGQGLFDYLDLLGEADDEAQQELAARVLADPDWRFLEVGGLRRPSRFEAFWRALGAGWEAEAAAPRLRAMPVEAWRTAHARWAQRWRRAQAHGLTVKRVAAAERPGWRAWIEARKTRALAAAGATTVLGAPEWQWLERMLTAEVAAVELWLLQRGEEPLAALVSWLDTGPPRIRHGYTICYEECAGALSPGILLLFAVVERTLAEGGEFDFLTGEQPFKLQFANDRQPRWRVWRDRRAAPPIADVEISAPVQHAASVGIRGYARPHSSRH